MLDVILRIDINLISMFLLAIVFMIANKRLDKRDSINKFYLITILIVITQLGIEAITCVINGRLGTVYRYSNIIFHVILFTIAPILSSGWYLIVRTFVNPNKKLSQKRLLLLFIPVYLNTIMTLLTPFFGLYFTFNNLNVYTRGEFFYIGIICSYVYLVISLIYLIKKRKNVINKEFYLLVVFIILPIIGGIIQGLFYGILLMWSSAAFGLVIVYIYLQERLIHLDDLTLAWTRKSFDYYINKRLSSKQIVPFGAIFFDIDNLKSINDNFGHYEGDLAIKEIITRVKSLMLDHEIVARIGGDEFIIIAKDNEVRLKELINDINLSLSVYNENSSKGYHLSLSYGHGLYKEDFKTMDAFLRFIDYRMYQNKSKNH